VERAEAALAAIGARDAPAFERRVAEEALEAVARDLVGRLAVDEALVVLEDGVLLLGERVGL
jgi:hypothetical protein